MSRGEIPVDGGKVANHAGPRTPRQRRQIPEARRRRVHRMSTRIVASADIDRAIMSRALALVPQAASLAVDIERTRRLPASLLEALYESQLFRLLLPRTQGGLETDPVTFFCAIEVIAAADASTAWCLAQAGGCAMAAAYLDAAVAQRVFSDPRAVLAWGPGSRARAVGAQNGS